MKQIKFFAMALAAMSMFSCSTEEAADATIPDGGDGSTAYAQFTLKMPDATRAITSGEETGSTAEGKITDATVYMVSKGVIYKRIELKAPVNPETKWKSDPIRIIAGSYQMLAVVNGNTKFTFAAGDAVTTTDTGLEMKRIATRDDAFTTTGTGVNKALVDVLFTSDYVIKDLSGGTETNATEVNLDVSRVVAKIVVRDNITVDATLPVTKPAYEPGKSTAAAFSVQGGTSRVGLYQRFVGGYPVNMDGVTHAAYATKFSTATYLTPAGSTTPLLTNITGDGSAATTTCGGWYTLENVAPKSVENQNATQLFIRVQLIPKEFTTAVNGKEANGTGANEIKNYIVVKPTNATYKPIIFKTEAIWTAWKAANVNIASGYDNKFVSYTDGYNYYRVPIVHNESGDGWETALKFSTMRNTIYEVKLKDLTGFGSNGDGTVTPGDPIEPESWIKATITILPWKVKSQEITLN